MEQKPAAAGRLEPLVLAAFFAIYVLWGTSFLGIRILVHEWPPLFAAGTRFFLAGAILLAWVVARHITLPTAPQWRSLILLALLMFVADYSALFWAEKFVPSGVASLLAATIPLMTVMLEIVVFRREPLRARIMFSTLLGFVGVGVLLLPQGRGTFGSLPLLPCLAILAGSFCFAVGGVLNRSLDLPSSKPLTSGASMLLGGAVLLALSAASSELHPFPHVSLHAVLALAYLIVFASVVAFTAYVWLLGRLPATRVNSYAYVNPVVAVALGSAVADEPLSWNILAGAALVLASIYLTLNRQPTTQGRA